MSLETQIEGILFYKTNPVSKESLATLLHVPIQDIERAIENLRTQLFGHALQLVTTDTMVQMTLIPDVTSLIEILKKDELRADIGKAGAETLSIILYRGPCSRVVVDKIRGVNSTYIIRDLLIRGLIEKRGHPTDSRSSLYAVTPELLNHMGLTSKETLPEFQSIMDALDSFEKQSTETESNELPQTL